MLLSASVWFCSPRDDCMDQGIINVGRGDRNRQSPGLSNLMIGGTRDIVDTHYRGDPPSPCASS